MLQADTFELVCQVNGKVRDRLDCAHGRAEGGARAALPRVPRRQGPPRRPRDRQGDCRAGQAGQRRRSLASAAALNSMEPDRHIDWITACPRSSPPTWSTATITAGSPSAAGACARSPRTRAAPRGSRCSRATPRRPRPSRTRSTRSRSRSGAGSSSPTAPSGGPTSSSTRSTPRSNQSPMTRPSRSSRARTAAIRPPSACTRRSARPAATSAPRRASSPGSCRNGSSLAPASSVSSSSQTPPARSIAHVGDRQQRLLRELEKLALYAGTGRASTPRRSTS